MNPYDLDREAFQAYYDMQRWWSDFLTTWALIGNEHAIASGWVFKIICVNPVTNAVFEVG